MRITQQDQLQASPLILLCNAHLGPPTEFVIYCRSKLYLGLPIQEGK